MVRKYNLIILVIILISGILVISDINGFAKSSRTTNKHRHHHHHHVTKNVKQTSPAKLVLRSSFALVEDQETSEVLVQKNARAVVPIASITKLMTAMVVLDADMDLQEEIVIDSQDIDTLRHSRSHLPVGTRLTRQEALLLALMSSENRAAQALSRTYPGGQTAFVSAMNAKARSLNLTYTHFSDPTGLSGQNVSSACELAKMVNAAYQYPLIRAMTTCEEAMIQSERGKLAFKNTNHLLRCPQWQIGLSKTGFIDEAGRCLVMQAHVAQRPVLIVLLDAPGTMTRFGDANRIRSWMERTSPPPVASKG